MCACVCVHSLVLLCVPVRVWCSKHYREYLVSLINGHSLDPALLYDRDELVRACQRYQLEHQRADNEDDNTYRERLLKVRGRCEQTATSLAASQQEAVREHSRVPQRTQRNDSPVMIRVLSLKIEICCLTFTMTFRNTLYINYFH